MEATLNGIALKQFTKSLLCLSKYSDDVALHATPEHLSLSVLGVNRTSYARFRYQPTFFDKYKVGNRRKRKSNEGTSRNVNGGRNGGRSDEEAIEEVQPVGGTFTGKLLLSVLRGSGTEKQAERCSLQFLEGVEPTILQNPEEPESSIETRLAVKMVYKHGVVKTHTLPLSTSATSITPLLPTIPSISTIQITGRTLKELVDHFPRAERRFGSSMEPLLIWRFEKDKTTFKTEDSWNSGKGDWIGNSNKGKKRNDEGSDTDGDLIYSSLNSSLSLSKDEFEAYEVYHSPVTLALHLKELNATLSVADALSSDIAIRFTSHGQPVFFSIDSNTGTYSAFCALSTKSTKEGDQDGKRPTQEDLPPSSNFNHSLHRPVNGASIIGRPGEGSLAPSGPMNGIAATLATGRDFVPESGIRNATSMAGKRTRDVAMEDDFGPPAAKRKPRLGTSAPLMLVANSSAVNTQNSAPSFAGVPTSLNPRRYEDAEPLFYPDSQAQVQPSQVLQEAGLGDLENMSQAQLREILEDDDFEMEVDPQGDFGATDGFDANEGGFGVVRGGERVNGEQKGKAKSEMSLDDEDEEGHGRSERRADDDWSMASQLGATQAPVQSKQGEEEEEFTPLFED